MAAPETRTVGRLLDGSGMVVGVRSGASIGVRGHSRAVVAPAAVLGFGGSVGGMKTIGFRSPIVGVMAYTWKA